MSWISCSCSESVVLFLISVDQETWNHFFVGSFFNDLGSGSLKMETQELYFQFSCVNEWTQTFSYFKHPTFGKVFFHLLGVLSTDGYQYLSVFCQPEALPQMLSLLPLDVDSLKALEVHKQVTEIFGLGSLFSKASGHRFLDYQCLLETSYSSPHFHLQRSSQFWLAQRISWVGRDP